MASFASLSREERLGLGVAAAAHVALVAALVWQVRDTPTPLPIPERMAVSLADEVSLRSTAPNPAEASAAVAPELAPLPVPAPAPEPMPTVAPREEASPVPRQTRAPVPRPTPTPTPAASRRPVTQPTASPTPRPTQTRAAGSRLGDDFLEGAGSSPRANTRGSQAATFGSTEQASLRQAITRQLKPYWEPPSGVDAERLRTSVTWELNEDGTLQGQPTCRPTSGVTDSNRPQAGRHCELAIRAIRRTRFDLPPQYYNVWKKLTWEFNMELSQ